MDSQSIAICALTYNRPEGLVRLVRGLDALTFRGLEPAVRVVIVDNDAQGGARQTCDQLAANSRWSLDYVVEPRRGIAFARNAALDNLGDAQLFCFIDDDEVPHPSWLDELLGALHTYEAAGVGGPVEPYFSESVPEWIAEGGFFERRRHATGTQLGHLFTNNCLLRRRVVDELGLRFDEQYALMGCEDRDFFQRIGMAGYKLVWADRALVTEWIPARRANSDWLVRRMYRVGNTTSTVEINLRPPGWTRFVQLAKSLVWLLIGLALLALGIVRGKATRLRGKRAVAYAAGLLTGVLGFRYEEYR